jgi:hypothetical protein
MADLRNNLAANTVAGVIIGMVGVANRFIVYDVPPIYDAVVGTLGRWGEPIFAVAMGFVLDFLDQRAQFLEQYRIPSRWFVYGIYRLVEEALGMIQGRGFAYVAKDGSIKTDPADEIDSIYMQKGDATVQVKPGSRTAVMGIRRYVAVGEKRVYYFEAPYELSVFSGGG